MDNPRVSILYLSLGSGHQVAAEALAHAIKLGTPEIPVAVEDPFTNAMKFLPPVLGGLQTASILLAPDLYDAVWRRRTMKSTPIENSQLLQDVLLEGVERCGSSVVVSTHVAPCIIANRLKRSGPLGHTKQFGIITDYGVNPAWPLEGMDGYFVAHEELRQSLMYRGVSPDVIHVTGIPIRPGFGRRSVANPSGRLRVLMMAGGIRNGGYVTIRNHITHILQSNDGLDPSSLEITIVAGNQPRLQQELKRVASENRYKVDIRGFVTNMDELMGAHDILVAKPGGLIVAEALASGLPIILAQPGPGVETANLEFLVRHGVALRGATADDTIRSLRLCVENPQVVQQMKVNARRLGLPNSAEVVARHILVTSALRTA